MVMKLIILIFVSLSVFSADVVKVGLFDVAPFAYKNEEGKLDGVIYTLAQEIEKESGLKFKYSLVPYARALEDLKAGKLDMAIFYPSEKYNGQFLPIAETLGNINYLVTNKEFKISDIADVKDKKVALIRGGKYSREFDNSSHFKKVYVKNYGQSLNMLRMKRIDAMAISSTAFFYLSLEKGLDPQKGFHKLQLNEKQNWIHTRLNLQQEIIDKLKLGNKKALNKFGFKSLENLLMK